jgi:tripartite ATP-independent transporter DctM subunit
MDANTLLVILMFLTFIGLLFSGYPIAFVLSGVAVWYTIVGYFCDIYLGTTTGLSYNVIGMIVNRIYNVMTNWVMVAIPMFIFMGLMLDRSGVAEMMMNAMSKLFGKVRGGLAVSVTFIGILLAAATGIIGASVVLLGLLALPAMLEQGYKKPLAVGTICASGTLGILIPPSIMLVIMADQLGIPVGDLFMGAVFPGLILGVLYITFLFVYCAIKKGVAPRNPNAEKVTFVIVWQVLKTILPTGCLVIGVLGSIFAGIATVTEASGVGALGASLLALWNKKLNFTVVKDVVFSTFSTVGYIFAIVIGATSFALVLRLLGGDTVIEKLFLGLPFGPYGILAGILCIIFLLGFFLDWIEITLIVLPLLAPIVTKLGISIEGYEVVSSPELAWLAILVAVTLQTSFLTPPVGYAIFYLKGICPPEVHLSDIYKGVIPFIILQLIGLTIVILWPELITWLPAVAYG